jgi:hypothetical protein
MKNRNKENNKLAGASGKTESIPLPFPLQTAQQHCTERKVTMNKARSFPPPPFPKNQAAGIVARAGALRAKQCILVSSSRNTLPVQKLQQQQDPYLENEETEAKPSAGFQGYAAGMMMDRTTGLDAPRKLRRTDAAGSHLPTTT